MHLKKVSSIFYAAALVAIFIGLTTNSHAQTVLYNFAGAADGADPSAGVILDSAGNIYGTTYAGGAGSLCTQPVAGCGTVFELSPSSSGWTHTVLISFDGDARGGSLYNGLVRDAAGNLYGVAAVGGDNNDCRGGTYPLDGCGVVFKLSKDSTGTWKETVIHTFTGAGDGGIPMSDLIMDSAGNLYGTTWYGGNLTQCAPIGCGVAFRLSHTPAGWHETVLEDFHSANGIFPYPSGLVMDASGNLYGAFQQAGNLACSSGCGSIYRLSPTASGFWTETTLYSFTGGADGAQPWASLTLDAAGNLYGTAEQGGANNLGVVYKLSASTSGSWTETVLHSFAGTNTDGQYPRSGVVFNNLGHLYGDTDFGIDTFDCPSLGCGAIYELTPSTTGWTETVLAGFNGGNGGHPSKLVLNSGTLYGTTASYGGSSDGVVFSQSAP